VPILACTATPVAAMQPGPGEKGFSGLIQKPCRVDSFMEAIEAQLAG